MRLACRRHALAALLGWVTLFAAPACGADDDGASSAVESTTSTTEDEVMTTTTEAPTTTTEQATSTTARTTTTRADPTFVSAANFGDAWPLTVSQGNLRCLDGSAVVFLGGGQVYALNGIARGLASDRGWREVDEIWRDDPALPGTKVNLHPLIERGLALC